jgi:hypothetical protein
LIFSDNQVTDMAIAMVGAFPVVAVAFYAVRAGPDDLRDISDEQKRIRVPDKWAKGRRWAFLQWVTPTFDESEEENSSAGSDSATSRRRSIPLGENVLFGLSPALRFGIVTDFCGVLVQSGRPVLR